jgi:hypothetical protein
VKEFALVSQLRHQIGNDAVVPNPRQVDALRAKYGLRAGLDPDAIDIKNGVVHEMTYKARGPLDVGTESFAGKCRQMSAYATLLQKPGIKKIQLDVMAENITDAAIEELFLSVPPAARAKFEIIIYTKDSRTGLYVAERTITERDYSNISTDQGKEFRRGVK